MRLPPGFYNTLSSILLSLILAILVWVAATNIELERLVFPSASSGLPIQLVNKPPGLIVTEGVDATVRVDLRIPREQSRDLQASDLVAEADLSGLGTGVHQVAVNVRAQPFAPSFRILKLVPDRIIVRVDEVITRTIPIELLVPDRATIPQTYQVLTTTLSPAAITISGPSMMVEPIDEVVARVRINGSRETIVRQVTPELIGVPASEEAGYLSVTPDVVTATVTIELRPGYRDLIVGTDVQGEPAPGYWVSEVAVEPRLVTVVGQPDLISQLDSIVTTAPINVEGLGEGEIIRNAPLQLPDGVSPLNDGSVQVRIRIEPQTSSKRVNIRPVVTGLQPGQVVTDSAVVPPEVTVLLQGPITELEQLDLDDVVVTLDASDKGVGTHLLEPQIKPPGTLRAESVSPQFVEITISEEILFRELERPLAVTGQAPGTVVALSPYTLSVALKGAASIMQRLVITDVRPLVELEGQAVGVYEIVPTLNLTSSVQISGTLPAVTATVYPESEVRSVLEPVTVVGLPPSLRATIAPAVVRVRVVGPGTSETLRQFGLFDALLNVAGLEPGEYLLYPRVQLPAGYTLVDITPAEVRVGIRTQP